MKKHNESKSIKGIRRSKGKTICKVISFTMVFVMLFCISASAEMLTITVKDQNGNIVTKEVVADISEQTELGVKIVQKDMVVHEEYLNEFDCAIFIGPQKHYIAGISSNGNYITVNYTEIITEEAISKVYKIVKENGEIIISVDDGATPEEVYTKWLEIIEPLKNNDFSEYITVYVEPSVYEGFFGNARGLFDMLFESIQSIFNWLVSPNVIVFFGLGIILSLTTIGILIARRFFWGR